MSESTDRKQQVEKNGVDENGNGNGNERSVTDPVTHQPSTVATPPFFPPGRTFVIPQSFPRIFDCQDFVISSLSAFA
ncbi:hypothetical protein NMY22_g20106 [Coprinellus aureogranulatus]|nr:hypothetical protein NMY22_g20106 [Coprinellus aureogranulatus]